MQDVTLSYHLRTTIQVQVHQMDSNLHARYVETRTKKTKGSGFQEKMNDISRSLFTNGYNVTAEELTNFWKKQSGRCYVSSMPLENVGANWILSPGKKIADEPYNSENFVFISREFKNWNLDKMNAMYTIFTRKEVFIVPLASLFIDPSPMRKHLEEIHGKLTNDRRVSDALDVTFDDIITHYDKQKGICALSGMPLGPWKSESVDWLATLYRKDEKIAFTKDNVYLVCREFNHQVEKNDVLWNLSKFETLYKTMKQSGRYKSAAPVITTRTKQMPADICEIRMSETLNHSLVKPTIQNLSINDASTFSSPTATVPCASASIVPTRKCRTCNETKSMLDFRKNKRSPGGHYSECKDCMMEKEKEASADAHVQLRKLAFNCKRNAGRNNEDMQYFDISYEALERMYEAQNKVCGISGVPFETSGENAISGKRKDNTKPYKIENYVLVTRNVSKARK